MLALASAFMIGVIMTPKHPTPTEQRALAPVVPADGSSTLVRFHDNQYGVVCYHAKDVSGIACLPYSALRAQPAR